MTNLTRWLSPLILRARLRVSAAAAAAAAGRLDAAAAAAGRLDAAAAAAGQSDAGRILFADGPKNPWGSGVNDTGKSGGPGNGGPGNGGSGNGGGGGPRNPWSVPPGTPRSVGPSALDELIRRARGGRSPGPPLPGAPDARTLWAIGAGLIVALWLLTCIHAIGPQQRGVVTYFGRYADTLDPGIRITMPAPIATVSKVDVQKISTEDFPEGSGGENLVLTGDQNIIDLTYSVRWDISNPQDYIFQIADPRGTIRATAESSMRAVVATTSLDDAIGAGRGAIEVRVQQMMQSVLDSYNSGVRIDGVAIKAAQPPAAVSDEFKAVTAAQQEAQGNINIARGQAQQILAHAQGEATSFDKVYAQYKLAPDVTRRRMYYETMEEVLAKSDKTVIEAPGVVPYLPLPGMRRLPDAEPAAPAAAAPAAPASGGGR